MLKAFFVGLMRKIVSVFLTNGPCERVRVAVTMIGLDFLAHSPFSFRCLEVAAGSDYRGARSPASGSDENIFLEYHCDCCF